MNLPSSWDGDLLLECLSGARITVRFDGYRLLHSPRLPLSLGAEWEEAQEELGLYRLNHPPTVVFSKGA